MWCFHPGRDEYIAMGLFHVAKAVAFLNNDCKLVSLLLAFLSSLLYWCLVLIFITTLHCY